MTTASGKRNAKRIKDALKSKFEEKQTTSVAGAVGSTKLFISGQIYDGAITGAQEVVNVGRPAAAKYAAKAGGGSVISTGTGGIGGSGEGSSAIYLHRSGVYSMLGPLDMAEHNIINVNLIDGVDLAAHVLNPNAHHNRQHSILSASDHTYAGGAALDVLGLSAPSTLAMLTPSAAPGATSALLKSSPTGNLTLPTFTASSKVTSPLIDTASGDLTLSPVGGTVTINGNIRTAIASGGTLRLFDNNGTRQNQLVAGADADGAFLQSTYTSFSAGGVTTLRFLGASTERMRITHNGNILINTTTDAGYKLDVNGTLRATTSLTTPLITTASGDLTIDPVGVVKFPQSQTLQSINFNDSTIPYSGWQIIEKAGVPGKSVLTIAEIQADELAVKVFVADETRVDRGDQLWAKSFGILAAEFTTPAISATAVIKFEDSPALVGALGSNNDWIMLQLVDRGVDLTIALAWGQISGYVNNGDGTQDWTFTMHSGPVGKTFAKGRIGINWGETGQAFIRLSTVSANAPYLALNRWAGANPYTPANQTTLVRLGNLNGGVGTLGTLPSYVDVPSGNGLFIRTGSNNKFFIADDNGVRLLNIDLRMYNSSTQTVDIASSNGTLKLGTNIASPTTTGFTFDGATGNVTIGNASYASTVTVYGVINVLAGSNVEVGATLGADWNNPVELQNRPVELTDGRVATAINSSGYMQRIFRGADIASGSVATGLNLTSTYMGYYDGSAFKTFIKNDGKFYFAGESGATIGWDGTDLFGTNGSTVQWYASSTDGKLYAAAGGVGMDATGLWLRMNSTASWLTATAIAFRSASNWNTIDAALTTRTQSASRYLSLLIDPNSIPVGIEIIASPAAQRVHVTHKLTVEDDIELFNGDIILSSGATVDGVDVSAIATTYLPLGGGTLTGTLTSRTVAPSANNTYNLGSSSNYYNNLYARNLFVDTIVGTPSYSHTHNASDIVSGTLADARIPTTLTGRTFSSAVVIDADTAGTQNYIRWLTDVANNKFWELVARAHDHATTAHRNDLIFQHYDGSTFYTGFIADSITKVIDFALTPTVGGTTVSLSTHNHNSDYASLSSYNAHVANANAHHNQSHVLATTAGLGSDHTVSGLTAGFVLRATGATTAQFMALASGDITAALGYTPVPPTRQILAGSAMTGGGNLSTDVTISHADTSSQASVDNSGGTVIQDVTLDTYGHVTALASANLDGRYLLATGATTGATSQAQAFVNGIVGSTAANDDITIQGTSHGTKTTSYVFLQPTGGNVAIGTLAPAGYKLEIYDAGASVDVGINAPGASAGTYAGFRLASNAVVFIARAFSAATGGGARTNLFSTGGYLLIGAGTGQYTHIYADNAAVVNIATTRRVYIGGSTTPTALLHLAASTTERASLRINIGAAPTAPNTGDVWHVTGNFYLHSGSTTYAIGASSLLGDLELTGELLVTNGSATVPTIANQADTNTGLYWSAADTLAVTAGGVQRATFGDIVTLNAATANTVNLAINSVPQWIASAERLNPRGSVLVDIGDYNRKVRTLHAAELYVETLVAQNVIATIGGRILVAPTTKLIADLTNVATTIDVEHNNFVNGTFIYMSSAPGGIAQIEAMKVVSAATTITGGYRYTVTRNLDGTGANSWLAGDAVVSLGSAVGHGYIDITSTATIHNHYGPTTAYYVRTSTAAWNSTAPVVALGNLRSFVDYSTDEFGTAGGNDLMLTPTTGFRGYTIDRTNGLRLFSTDIKLYNGATQTVNISAAGTDVWIGTNSSDKRLSWNGTTLSVVGSITVTGGSGIASFSDANLDNIANGSTYFRTTANQVTGAGRAYTAINSSNNLVTSVIPASAITPGGAGLYLGSNYMGYYSGSAWKTYIDNSGNFRFLGNASNNYIQWVAASNKLQGVGGGVEQWYADATDGKLYAGGGNVFLDTLGLTIQSGGINRLQLAAAGPAIRVGAPLPSYGAETGIWIGIDGSTPKMRVGTISGQRLLWDGSALSVYGSVQILAASGFSGSGYLQVGSGTKDSNLNGWNLSSSEIVGQASGVDQVVLGTNGQIVAGAGTVALSSDGINIATTSTTAASLRIGGDVGTMRALTFSSWPTLAIYGTNNTKNQLMFAVRNGGDAQFANHNAAIFIRQDMYAGSIILDAPLIQVDGDLDMNGNDIIDAGYLSIGANAIRMVNAVDSRAIIFTPFDNGALHGTHLTLQRNSNASTPAAGFLLMVTRNNSSVRTWFDNAGNLRAWTGGNPTYANDTSGTVVGTQTSSLDSKNVIGEFTDYDQALKAILAVPLHDFTYKSGAFNGEQFTGVITDYAPLFGMDRDDAHPAGKSLNEITAHGYSMAAIKALYRRIEQLETEVVNLRARLN